MNHGRKANPGKVRRRNLAPCHVDATDSRPSSPRIDAFALVVIRKPLVCHIRENALNAFTPGLSPAFLIINVFTARSRSPAPPITRRIPAAAPRPADHVRTGSAPRAADHQENTPAQPQQLTRPTDHALAGSRPGPLITARNAPSASRIGPAARTASTP